MDKTKEGCDQNVINHAEFNSFFKIHEKNKHFKVLYENSRVVHKKPMSVLTFRIARRN